MNIAIFSECYKPTLNGVVVSIDTFRNELLKKGHKVFVIAPKPKIKNYQEEGPYILRVPSIALPGKSYYPIGLPYFTKIPKIISKLNLDIIHIQHPFIMGKFGRKIAKKNKIPTVYTYHTLLIEYAHYFPIFKGLVKKYLISVSKNFSNSADQIIAPSQSIKNLLINYGVKKPIDVLPTGIPINEYKNVDSQKTKEQYHIDPKNKILIYVGRLAEEKNISFLLKAYKEIHLQYPQTHLILVGGGEKQKFYENQVRNLNLKNITFTGQLPKKETNIIFGAGDIFLMPSLTDTQGIVVVEALSSELPCIVMDKFGPAEIIEEGKSGFKVEPDNIKEFAKKTVELLKDDKLREKMSQEAKKRAEDFDSVKSAEKLFSIYQKTIENYQGKE